MKLTKMVALSLLIGGLWTIMDALAADLPDMGEPPAAQLKAETHANAADYLSRDAVCTKCHDESEVKPVLSIFATKHGVGRPPHPYLPGLPRRERSPRQECRRQVNPSGAGCAVRC